MKSFDPTKGTRRVDPQSLPRFELEYLVDDMEYPSQVMVVPHGTGDRSETEWITVDIRDAVPLEWVR